MGRPVIARRSFTWNEIYERLGNRSVFPDGKVYGIPRGGSIVAGALSALRDGVTTVSSPEEADYLVDDVYDSGATVNRWREITGKHCSWLVDKPGEHLAGVWVEFPWESLDTTAEPRDLIVRLLEHLGEDASRDGLAKTPDRVIRSLAELTAGYRENPAEILSAVFKETCDELVVVHGIEFWSLCEHHLLPFHGTATVGYLPGKLVVGLSKLARLVHCFSRRLQVQERMTAEIADALQGTLQPRGVGVLVRATHTCMAMRGVKASGATMTTSALRGECRTRKAVRDEFLALAR